MSSSAKSADPKSPDSKSNSSLDAEGEYVQWAHFYRRLREQAAAQDWSAQLLSTGKLKPSGSLIAKIVEGTQKVDYKPEELAKGRFMMLGNRKENEDNWNSKDAQWVGKAAMSLHHKFLVPAQPLYQHGHFCVNAAIMPADSTSVQLLDEMEQVALKYAKDNWKLEEKSVGLYFHCWPFASIPHLHLHVVDLRHTSDSFTAHSHNNVPLRVVRRVLSELVPKVAPPGGPRASFTIPASNEELTTGGSLMQRELALSQTRSKYLDNLETIVEIERGRKHTETLCLSFEEAILLNPYDTWPQRDNTLWGTAEEWKADLTSRFSGMCMCSSIQISTDDETAAVWFTFTFLTPPVPKVTFVKVKNEKTAQSSSASNSKTGDQIGKQAGAQSALSSAAPEQPPQRESSQPIFYAVGQPIPWERLQRLQDDGPN